MKAYSVAIRTLGLNPTLLKEEIESIYRQSVQPAKVVVYIARGYKIPDFRVADEIYVYTPKGMMTQRALPYDDIDTPYLLFMDDDVVLGERSAELLITALEEGGYDVVAPDMFQNHNMSVAMKLYVFLTSLTRPSYRQDCAFRILNNGAFAYINRPKRDVYPTQSAPGPCSLWRKDAFLRTNVQDELWLEDMGFPYCEDQIAFYKLYLRGGKAAIHFDSRVENRDAKTSSGDYHKNPMKFHNRAKAQYLVWHRSLYHWRKSRWGRLRAAAAFWFKFVWQIPIHCVAAVTMRNIKIPYLYVKGTIDGIKYSHSAKYLNLPPYVE